MNTFHPIPSPEEEERRREEEAWQEEHRRFVLEINNIIPGPLNDPRLLEEEETGWDWD